MCYITLLSYLKHICDTVLVDGLIGKVMKNLPQEIEGARKQKWDSVLVNQYLCELKEAKKQGRKERRHKEAQAVLAAATAAAAASSRISSFRKDSIDESAHQEVVNSVFSALFCLLERKVVIFFLTLFFVRFMVNFIQLP